MLAYLQQQRRRVAPGLWRQTLEAQVMQGQRRPADRAYPAALVRLAPGLGRCGARWGSPDLSRDTSEKSGSRTAVPHQRGTAVKAARKRRCWCASGPHAHGGQTASDWMICTKTRTWRSWTATLAQEAVSMAADRKGRVVRADVSRNREGPLDPHHTTP